MTESVSQGIPYIDLNQKARLYKCNDISFTNLRNQGFSCRKSSKKPDQLVVSGERIIIGIEDKFSSKDIEIATKQIKDDYLEALPDTSYFIARAGERTRILYRLPNDKLIEIGTTLRGKEVSCFGPRVITGENKEAKKFLALLARRVLAAAEPVNASIEIDPPKQYYNPLIIKQSTIRNLWQKIFVSTGENAPMCLSTFVELLLFKGVSDAGMLKDEFSIKSLIGVSKPLYTYKNSIRQYINQHLFPSIANQPGVVNGFAFEDQKKVFKNVLKDLNELGNLAQQQIDPDFKRRVIEAFLGSAHGEGTIRSGKHLTPRSIIQAIWEMAEPGPGKKIVDPACGVGGFVLEGLNYPYEYNPLTYNCLGFDRDEQMIITAKANMILHILDKFADPQFDNRLLSEVVNKTFIQVKNNGTGTLGEVDRLLKEYFEFQARYSADYVFSNVPFYINGVKQIDDSLKELGYESFYHSCGLGVESRFLKYILSQIKSGDPGIAFVIVTDGILYRHKDKIREVMKEQADILGIVSLPVGCFQNNNWKTSILIFKKKTDHHCHFPVFLYNVENIGVSLDAYRTPTDNDLPGLKNAWKQRDAGKSDDPKCRFIEREEFLKTKRWSDLFAWCREEVNHNNVSFSEFIESAENINNEIGQLIETGDKSLGNIFSLDAFIEIELDDSGYFKTGAAKFKTTVRHARLNPGKYPLFSSQVNGPVEYMFDPNNPPILYDNEINNMSNKIISWNIKGDPCKDVRQHDTPFYCTENRGLIQIVSEAIDFDYLLCYLREHMISAGKFSRSDEAHVGKVKKLMIKLPIDEQGDVDLAKQNEIAGNYQNIKDLRQKILNRVEQLEGVLKNIDVFK